MGGPPAKSFVPAKYQSPQTSELTVEIAPGEDAKEVNLICFTLNETFRPFA
jgi:hypothetical protein